MDATLTIAPPPWRIMLRPTAWEQRNTPVRLTSRTDRQSSNPSSSAGAGRLIPALLTRRSTRRNVSSATSVMADTARGAATSVSTAIARHPSASSSRTVSSAEGKFVSAATTDAPQRQRARQTLRPIPAPPPVTMATEPERLKRSARYAAPGRSDFVTRARPTSMQGPSAKGLDDRQRLAELDHRPVLDADLHDAPPAARFDRVHEFHDLDDPNRIVLGDEAPELDEGRSSGSGGPVEGAHHRRLHLVPSLPDRPRTSLRARSGHPPRPPARPPAPAPPSGHTAPG